MSKGTGNLDRFSLKNSLKSRLMRFRLTALPTFLLTVSPSLLVSEVQRMVMTVK